MRTRIRKLVPGFAATMVGIAFSRFSFTPISALLVEKGILSSREITIVAAAMMAGYAVGAFSAHRASLVLGSTRFIHLCFLTVVAGLLLEGLFTGFWSLAVIRFGMAAAGAGLMVLGPGLILSTVSPPQRAFAAGVVFTGVGTGIVIAGSVVALVTQYPIFVASGLLVATSVLVTFLGWGPWPKALEQSAQGRQKLFGMSFAGLVFAYGLSAVAYIPHTAYLSDFVASELGHGADSGGVFWAIFGAGGFAGAIGGTWLRRSLGGQLSIEVITAIKAVFILLVGFTTSLSMIALSAFLVGAMVTGMAMTFSTRTADLVGPENVTRAWGIMTGAFAIGQFAGAVGMAVIYQIIKLYQPLFLFGGVLEALALVVLIVSMRIFSDESKGQTK